MSAGTRARILVAAVALGVTPVAPAARDQAQPRAVPSASDLSRSLEATARVVGASVVEIFATTFAPGQGVVPRNADLVTTQRASGSGVIVAADGYIVTNAHVVARRPAAARRGSHAGHRAVDPRDAEPIT